MQGPWLGWVLLSQVAILKLSREYLWSSIANRDRANTDLTLEREP